MTTERVNSWLRANYLFLGKSNPFHPLLGASVPSMKKITQLNIPLRISSHWRVLGLRVGQSYSELENLNMRNNIKCSEEILKYWLEESSHPSKYPRTWQGLYDLLCDIEHRGTAEDMKEELSRESM